MSLTREDIYHSFPEDIKRAEISTMLKYYDRKGVDRYCFTYRGRKVENLKLKFLPSYQTVEIELG